MLPNADGSFSLNVVCKTADVMATPQTVPIERTRYIVEAETAWSMMAQISTRYLSLEKTGITGVLESGEIRE